MKLVNQQSADGTSGLQWTRASDEEGSAPRREKGDEDGVRVTYCVYVHLPWRSCCMCRTPRRNTERRRDGVLPVSPGVAAFSKTRLQLILIISN